MLCVHHGTPLIITASSPLICLGGVCDHGLACHWLPPPSMLYAYSPLCTCVCTARHGWLELPNSP